MAAWIEDYGLIGDCQSAALVSRDGSVDWLCWPRFDSDACFAALLGDPSHGRWKIAPTGPDAKITRRYLRDTLVLETTFETSTGCVALIDFMAPGERSSHLVRIVAGVRGSVAMRAEFILRFGYGRTTPWVTRTRDKALLAVAGADMAVLRTRLPLRGEDMTTVADFTVSRGERIPFVLSYGPSQLPRPAPLDAEAALAATRRYWRRWSRAGSVAGPYAGQIARSLLTIKALSYAATGGLVAAPTTSLPEQFGGARNWDYRYGWIRDSSLILLALMNAGHSGEAKAWARWLHRAVAGSPADMQTMYGLAGERRLLEWEASWLPGYEGARPVRIGNAAHEQFQLDVFGELMIAFHHARQGGLIGDDVWDLQRVLIDHVAQVWNQPDEGIWEVRGPPRHFTFSKVMAWVAFDRAVKAVEEFGMAGPVDEWRDLRARIAAEIRVRAVNPATGGFQRAYDDPGVDASLLLVADLGFVEPDDPLFVATVAAVEDELITADGLVLRYDTVTADDGLPPGEGAFLPCSFWLVNAYARMGRTDDARRLFERLLDLANDLGLLAEEYDPVARRLCGNFPQGFTHVALISAATHLANPANPALRRAR